MHVLGQKLSLSGISPVVHSKHRYTPSYFRCSILNHIQKQDVNQVAISNHTDNIAIVFTNFPKVGDSSDENHFI